MSFAIGKIKLSGITDKGNGLFEVAAAAIQRHQDRRGQHRAGFMITLPQSSAEYWYVKTLGDNPTPAGCSARQHEYRQEDVLRHR